ncbi:MAG: hypothetical protein ACKOES_09575 [Planctomycetaceae bacterium]
MMQRRIERRTWCMAVVTVAVVTGAVVVTTVQAGPPALSINPGNLAIFPAKGQTPE